MKALLAILFAAIGLVAADVLVIDEIIAKVNGDIITKSELDRTKRDVEQQLRQQQNLTGERLAEAVAGFEKDILRDRIDSLLLTQKGKELNLNVDAEVTKQIAAIQRETGISDPDKFQQFLREQTGMPFEDYRNDMKNYLIQQRVIRQEVGSTINIKKEELKKYYDEHQSEFQREERVFLSEIFVASEGKDAAVVDRKAKDLAARGKKGEKFNELAQANSDAPSAPEGGYIGQFQKGQLATDIETAVWPLTKGGVTDPIKRDNGFLIYKVEEHQMAGLATFEEVESEIMNTLFNPRMGPAMRVYLTKLRQDAFLEIKEGFSDSSPAPGKNTAWTDPAQLRPETTTKKQVLAQIRRKRLLWLVPVPGTIQRTGTSSSR